MENNLLGCVIFIIRLPTLFSFFFKSMSCENVDAELYSHLYIAENLMIEKWQKIPS